MSTLTNIKPHLVNITLCGGAGISLYANGLKELLDKYKRDLEEDLVCGYPIVKLNFIDTSLNNIKSVEHSPSDFWQVVDDKMSNTTIDGSGGIRVTNADAISKNIRQFCDNRGYTKKVAKETHIVVFSGSGGSGSVSGTVLVKVLTERGIPVLPVIIGDADSHIAAENTYKTLASMSNIALNNKVPIPIIYVNNTDYNIKENNREKAIARANDALINSIGTMLIFLSGVNEAIDYQDMAGFILPTAFTEPGIYNIIIAYGNNPKLPENSVTIMARTLGTKLKDIDTSINNTMFIHQKVGYVTGNAALKTLDSYFPVHAIMIANYLDNKIKELEEIISKFKAMKENIKPLQIEIKDKTNEDGLLL